MKFDYVDLCTYLFENNYWTSKAKLRHAMGSHQYKWHLREWMPQFQLSGDVAPQSVSDWRCIRSKAHNHVVTEPILRKINLCWSSCPILSLYSWVFPHWRPSLRCLLFFWIGNPDFLAIVGWMKLCVLPKSISTMTGCLPIIPLTLIVWGARVPALGRGFSFKLCPLFFIFFPPLCFWTLHFFFYVVPIQEIVFESYSDAREQTSHHNL